MNAHSTRTVFAASIALAAIVATSGCAPPANNSRTTETSGSVEASVASTTGTMPPAASDASAVATAAPVTITPGPTPPPPPSQSKPAPKPKLGPKDASVSWAYLKDMYKKDGYWYVVVDYIQVVGPEETLHFVNENPKLRVFPLSEGVKLQLLKDQGSPDYKSVSAAQFKAFQKKSGDEVVEVTPKGGYAVRLKEWWAP